MSNFVDYANTRKKMNNKECKEHIINVLTVTPDNDKRDASDKFPCCVTFGDWNKKEIDNQPEGFDWQQFWRDCKEYYPLHSVAGGYTFKNEEQIKDEEYRNVPVDVLPKRKGKVLEIGFGFGGAARRFKEKGFKYYGIDYVTSGTPNREYGDFIEIKESGIPKELLKDKGKFSMVYSDNVFQHLTSKQRKEYYDQVHTILKPGGTFYFSLFTRNEDGMKEYYSYPEHKNHGYATHFFGVHTNVPNLSKLKRHLKKVGFDIVSENRRRLWGDIRTDVTRLVLKKR